MARLPKTGHDNGVWGDILNDFLLVEHDAEGHLRKNGLIVGAQQANAKGQANGYASLDLEAKIPTSQLALASAAGLGIIQLAGDLAGSATIPRVKNMPKVFNVHDFGAIGDGLTDDRVAIQNTIDTAEASGGVVFVPQGVFLVDPSIGLSLKNNITLSGTGRASIIKVPDGANTTGNLLRIEGKSNIIVANMMLDGNRAAQTSGTNYGAYVASSANVKVSAIWTNNFTGVGSHVYDCDGVTVSNCTSSNNVYHGFECEQARNCSWQGNRGYANDRHGIFVSPGEVGGSGAKANSIIGNSFDVNGQYGISVGIAAAPGSELLSSGTIIANNSVRNNAHYGISLYYQDGSVVTGNLVEGNGFFGVHCYKSRQNQITGNRLHANSQAANGAYDEVIIEGSSDGRSSRDNLISDNVIVMDAAVKARYGVNEATAADGPNMVVDNVMPTAGTAGTLNIQNGATVTSESVGYYQVGGGQVIDGSNAGIDNAFNILRVYSNLPNSEVQVVSTTGGIKFWANGTERFLVNADGSVVVNTDTLRLSIPKTPATANASGVAGDIAWDSDFMYVCIANNSWKRSALVAW